jgi:putative membrane-bound dehydrogenase-like protein
MDRISHLLLGLAVVTATAVAADFPTPFNSGQNDLPPPMSSRQAAETLLLPAGFRTTDFASEPSVQNPIALAWDAHGRLWVAENYTYAERARKFELGLRDRVLILEDPRGEGRATSRRVFIDSIQRLTSVEVGHGGVWLMCPPQLLFVHDRNEDGVADGAPEVVLDGFRIPSESYHNFANGLRFGPDGWLYGRCGASSPGDVGAPGTPDGDRIPLLGTMWRYHPQRKVFEALGSGTTNPWGHDWDKHGELFFINTVNGHFWHGIAGAHYVRGVSLDPNPHVYELIDQHADHVHFDSSRGWTASRAGAANDLGGGHAHAGLLVYQGDNWPASYRDRAFTLNFHGRRMNQERLERHGSGYVARHEPDFALWEDPWFRGIDLISGPDGGVFVIDWSDTGECHNHSGVNRASGRIVKIVHEDAAGRRPDAPVASLSPRELVTRLAHANVWHARQAQLQLATRAALGRPLEGAVEALRSQRNSSDVVLRLRTLWALHAIGAAPAPLLREALRDDDEHVRTWAVRLLTDAWPLDTPLSARPVGAPAQAEPAVLRELVALAGREASPLVRLALATVLQRLPTSHRTELAAALVRHRDDASDHNLPLMIWYGLIPLGGSHPGALADVAAQCELPATRRLAARRLAEDLERAPAALDQLIATAAKKPVTFQRDVVAGMSAGLRGWRRAAKPASWDTFARSVDIVGDSETLAAVRDLSVLFGDGRALDDLKAIALDAKAEVPARKAALHALIENRTPDLRATCEKLLGVRHVNLTAVRGLALFDDPELARRLADSYRSIHHTERAAYVETMVSRPALARALLDGIEAGRIPRDVVTPFHVRQIRSFGDAALTRRLAEVWGESRESDADKQAAIAKARNELDAAVLAAADLRNGRRMYSNLCAACHQLYGEGGNIGPDITGSQRSNLDYLLENIIDPSAVVNADFRMAVVKLKDGRTLNGFIAARTPRTITIRGLADTHTIERDEIAAIEESPHSIMPEGLFESLTSEHRRDLIAYLMHPAQVPLD